ncbi:MAG: hypothetical protein LBO06_02470 [Bacteroidales bacterium]|jgi:hypothetical protein|nr:hypothetical protein [Bacteroidales bacterium]
MAKELTKKELDALEAQKQAEETAMPMEDAAKQKEVKVDIAAKAKRLFKSFPQADILYFTSDGTAFMSECDASNHAHTLTDDKVQTIKRK